MKTQDIGPIRLYISIGSVSSVLEVENYDKYIRIRTTLCVLKKLQWIN